MIVIIDHSSFDEDDENDSLAIGFMSGFYGEEDVECD